MHERRYFGVVAFAAGAAACGPSAGTPDGGIPTGSAEGYTLAVRAGLYETGSRRGLALLATLRDASGRGPSIPWSLSLRPPSGDATPLTYDDGAEGSFSGWWFEGIEPQLGRFYLEARGTHSTITLPFEVLDRSGVLPPQPALAADGSTLAWAAPAGAASFACRFYAGAALAASTSPSTEPRCEVGGLSDGSYTAAVLAFGADLPALAADRRPAPDLPPAFHVAEGRIGFTRGPTGGYQLRAAGGALNFGPTGGGLVFWLALSTADGNPPAEAWAVSVVGPGLSASAPLTTPYPAGAFQRLVWSYDLPPRTGTYAVTAESAGKRVATQFGIGDSPRLPIIRDIQASPLPTGAAEVSWTPAECAASFWVNVWPTGAGATTPTASVWTREPPAKFGVGTFEAGKSYDVYVAAADVDMTLAAPPPGRDRVAVSENTYSPASFTAP